MTELPVSSYAPGTFAQCRGPRSYADVAVCDGCGITVNVSVREDDGTTVPEECEACGGRLVLE